MRDREDRERDRVARDEEDKRRAETDRRGEQLREAWRQRHPEENRKQAQPIKDQRELEDAGWERLERDGEIVWRNPENGFVYPAGIALSMVREGADPDAPLGPEGAL